MTEVNLQLVREFFELNGFRVSTNFTHGDHGPQVLAERTGTTEPRELGTVLVPGDLVHIARAVVEVRAWHADRFYASVAESNAAFTQFAQPEALGFAHDYFGGAPFHTILVVSELPVAPDSRAAALRAIRASNVEFLIEFPAILRDLINKVSINGNYFSSHTLQVIQLLKRYRLFRNQQMELLFPREPHAS